MTEQEREQMIAQLVWSKGWNEEAFRKMDDRDLQKEWERQYGE